ncbi:MAG TPA: hypothetical protein IAA98_08275 [Candidatus Avipropionibacterium avicola]|uniref:Streptomycin 6-kinase n=1 Tax=Candidatus Avipropionibacterium avicola TaxID=2840701 RepID=A0A9D1GXE8_9ACTN|nr:hypothetical protein [Candidatus Avipropionibacterium avicola]
MIDPWAVPTSFRRYVQQWPKVDQWFPQLSVTAARCAERWQLSPDGAAMHGWTGVVWPVRLRDGVPAVLKVSPPVGWTEGESRALAAFARSAGQGRMVGQVPVRMVTALAFDVAERAMVLPRLDPDRSLEHHGDVDEAVTVIAELLAGIAPVRATEGLPDLVDELDEMVGSLQDNGSLDRLLVERARSRLAEVRIVAADPDRRRTLHADCHFLNVLHTRAGESPAWVGIDPSAVNGIIEWEPVPMLRNRWADVAATGDPDRALRRRVDQLCEVTGADRDLVRSCAQVQAVAALTGWQMSPQHLHHPPYAVMARW